MEHSKIFVRPDGSKLRILVQLLTFRPYQRDRDGNLYRYDILEWLTPPGKRKEMNVTGNATRAEIFQAKKELHDIISPKF